MYVVVVECVNLCKRNSSFSKGGVKFVGFCPRRRRGEKSVSSDHMAYLLSVVVWR